MPSGNTLVVVKWHDAEDNHETWADAEDIEKFGEAVMEVTSVGWEVKRTKLYITIAADKTPDGTYGRITKVPLAMVLSVESVSQ